MKKLLALTGALISFCGIAQTTTVSYAPTTASFSNPERGFYRHTETHSDSYSSLNQTTLTNYRVNNKYTLVLRLCYLENFVNANISSSYLTAMQADFTKIRNAGLKCILRFAYSDDNDNGNPQDASKAQILAHIGQLQNMLQENADVIAVVQAGFIGAWGEWYYTDHFGMEPTATDYQNRKAVVDALLAALPTSRMVQLRTPSLKRNTYTTSAALTAAQAFSTSLPVARIGHHNDCFLASEDDYGTYNNIGSEYPYLEQETKYTPMGGETCAVNEPRSECETALLEMAKFHWSYLNVDYHPDVIDGFESNSCLDDMERRLGYRFELQSGTYPNTANIGSAMAVSFQVKNTGFAAPYNPRTAYIVLKNTTNGVVYSIPLATNVRLWQSNTTQTVTESIVLPNNMTTGAYQLYLNLPDPAAALSTRPEYSIRMANDNVWDNSTGYNSLNHTINVGTALGVGDNPIATELRIYPVPTHGELTVEYDGIEDFKATVFNSVGQVVGVRSSLNGNKMLLNTSGLSNGIYFVQLDNGSTKTVKKFIVSN
ncbi:DUF4832 domain-containing protein [Flavobacterium sp. MAH-1]|uniref:DUF4832 domain-containing protein n=1 Tax=Flavobacterium agri TaxID=2743471 RepID=A0A7Y8XZS1_9FLAO|nr:DUF4832 domain-containing protein [Flavobacterium agri]NUY79914.1 DUF4832 domain-containing protein [Flavobacterium agri]NYA69939.1 DUF4832 domain-containing protein [Flavobacterium agri]